MFRFNTLTLSAFILTASLVHAQTGPTGPASPAPATNNNVATQQMTPERLDNYLRSKGHTTRINKLNNGAVIIASQIQQDGWRFDVDFEFGADLKNFNITCKLGSPQSQYSPAQLLALLKKNYDMGAFMHFAFREGDRQLVLDAPLFGTIITETQLQNGLNAILKTVRDTHPLWDTSRWPTTQVAGPVAPPTNVPAPPPTTNIPAPPPAPAPAPQPPMSTGLANTTWVGNETLENFGRLEFRFGPNGQVLMVDAAGQAQGTYAVQGSTVTITFANCVYTGTINGQTLSGMAQAGSNSWSFSVSR